jgi:hypothetical protein
LDRRFHQTPAAFATRDGSAHGSVQSARRSGEWEALGFCCGPLLMWLARQALPCDLADSRVLRCAESAARLQLAALVVSADRGTLALLDEGGLFESECGQGVELPGEAELVLVEGSVDVRHGLAVLKGARVSGWHPGVLSVKHAEAA